jgi:choline-glycine betaine transporter
MRKRPLRLSGFVVLGLLLGSSWIALSHPDWVLQAALISILPSFLVLFMRPKKLSLNPPLYSFWQWQARWWGACGVLCCLWVAHMLAWATTVPPNVATQMPSFQSMQAGLWFTWGYPWSFYTLLALVYSHLAYTCHKPIPEGVFEPFVGKFKASAQNMGGIVIALSTQLSLIFTFITGLLLVLKAVEPLFPWPSHWQWGLWTPLFMSSVLLMVRRIPWRSWAQKGVRHGIGLGAWSLGAVFFLLATILGFNAITLHWLPNPATFLPIDSVIVWKMNQFAPPELRFQTLLWSWWMLWAPLMASYLAYISRGQKGVWGMACLTPLVLSQLPLMPVLTGLLLQAQTLSVAGFLIIAFGVGVVLYVILRNQRTTQRLVQGFITEPRPRVLKVQGLGKMLAIWMNVLVGVVFIQALSGWYFLQVQLVTPALLMLLFIGFVTIYVIHVRYWPEIEPAKDAFCGNAVKSLAESP